MLLIPLLILTALLATAPIAGAATLGSVGSDCEKGLSDPALDPLRSRMPIGLTAETTDDMRRHRRKVTMSERTALAKLREINLGCADALAAVSFPDNQSQRDLMNSMYQKRLDESLQPLMDGRITFAEYLDREALATAELNAQIRAQRLFTKDVQEWLAGLGPGFAGVHLWDELVAAALAIAANVDGGRLGFDEGRKQIESAYVRFKANLEAQKVTLSCVLAAPNGFRGETPVVIDYARSQVNGLAARVTENIISWQQQAGNYLYNYSINRLTGTVNVSAGDFPQLFTGPCTIASRKF